jgi:glyoxylase-like metal-dependent hydrolase (beta-lactamase superfamily II)
MVLVDTGIKGSSGKIVKMAEEIFGEGAKPSSIILTHGHFDHSGSVEELIDTWNVPVFAHELEMPYLTGRSNYPPADPMAGGGMMSLLSFMYPTGSRNFKGMVQVLQEEDHIPGLPGWEFIHTPGHTPGHISLYRKSDRLLLSGDAMATTHSESVFSAMLQMQKVCGPPKFLTIDWEQAYSSVKKLRNLTPATVAAGHGKPISGDRLTEELEHMVENFKSESVPAFGRYTGQPAKADESGVTFVPPMKTSAYVFLGLTAALLAFTTVMLLDLRNSRKAASSSY